MSQRLGCKPGVRGPVLVLPLSQLCDPALGPRFTHLQNDRVEEVGPKVISPLGSWASGECLQPLQIVTLPSPGLQGTGQCQSCSPTGTRG